MAGARTPDSLTRQLDHRLGVLEKMGYVEGWALTPEGRQLSRIYHECDLLIAEALRSDIVERGRARRPGRGVLHRRLRAAPGASGRRATSTGRAAARSAARSRTGSATSARRTSSAGARPSRCWPSGSGPPRRTRACRAPGSRPPASSTAVASWARGASLAVAMGVAGRDVGELAPGDFVRTMKSVADLAQQVSHTAADPAVAAAAREAVNLLLRGVVAGGLPGA